jgi:NADPH:quinone reductase-like Zn-dependent oxidoreductase/SAM-dependent methyltransferase
LDRCGAALPAVLQGKADGLSLLFPSDGGTAATRLYETDIAGLAANAMAREALAAIVGGLPAGRKVRVLEAGAGTGGTTPHLLAALPAGRSEYTFTDISVYFTEQANEKFRSYGFVRTQVFDIERDAVTQGLPAGGFDVVVAANVVHALADVHTALENLERLVAPGGVLLLIEATHPAAWLDCTFGLTKGWWRFADGREHPLLPAEKWRGAAADCGFATVSTHTVEGQTLVVATKAAAITERASGTWVVLSDGAGVGEQLAGRLRADGCEVVTVRDGASYREIEPGRFEMSAASSSEMQLFSMGRLDRPLAGVVYLWGLAGMVARPSYAGMDAGVASLEACSTVCLPLLNLLRNLVRNERLPRVWIATRGAVGARAADELGGWDKAQLWGMAQAARLEHPELGLTCVDLDGSEDAAAVYAELRARTDDRHVAYRAGERLTARLTRAPRESHALEAPAGAFAFTLDTRSRGDLDALELRTEARRAPGAGEVEIAVRAAGLNFLDVLDALAALPFERGWLGGECSGVVTAVGEGVTEFAAGDEVVALAAGAFGTHAVADARVTVRKPGRLSFAEAAGFPVAFLTARLALDDVRAGERVLIHAISGGTGMAAWQLARRAGAEVFGTASPGKRERLRAMGIDAAMNSRTTSFATEALAQTRGRGVDVVLNALTGEFIPAGLRALARGGRFVEIGKSEIWSGDSVARVRDDVTYRAVDLFAYSRENPGATGAMLREIAAALDEGSLQPLPVEGFAIERAVTAFRAMQSARHVGKIVLTVGPEAAADGAVLIAGGTSGLGLLTAEWLAERGVREIVLAARRTSDAALEEAVAGLRARGCSVTTAAVDITDRAAVAELLAGRSLRGVVHAAGLLHDGLVAELEWPRFERVLGPKVTGLWNLHELTRGMALEFFVAYSSVASVLGSAGQSNHAAANAFVDSLMAWRRRNGLPGLSINWGPWSELGGAARMTRATKERQRQSGIGSIGTRKGRALLPYLWRHGSAGIMAAPIDWSRFRERVEGQPFFQEFLHTESRAGEARRRIEGLRGAGLRDAVARLVLAELRAVLGHEEAWLPDEEQGFFGLGMDSLTSLELRNRLEKATGLRLAATALFDHPSPERLTEHLVGSMEPEVEATAPDRGREGELDELDAQELAKLLEAKLSSMESEA